MKKYIISLVTMTVIIYVNNIHAQNSEKLASNISQNVEDGKLKINYDLAPAIYDNNGTLSDFKKIKVALKIMVDGDEMSKLQFVDGTGYVDAGDSKEIIWDAHSQDPDIDLENVEVEILTEAPEIVAPKPTIEPNESLKKGLPLTIGLGGLSIAGATTFILGVAEQKDADGLLDIYKTRTEPTDLWFLENDITRDELFESAGSTNDSADLKKLTGGITFLASSYFLVKRFIDSRSSSKKLDEGNYSLKPSFESTSAATSPGISFIYKFN